MIEDFIHQSLVGCPCIFETEWHDLVEAVGIVYNEGGFFMSDVAMGIWL